MKRAGLDIGSTTVKAAVIGENGELLYSQYRRHFSDIRKTVFDIISELGEHFKGERMMIAVTGSGGISVSKWLGIPFVQEVAAGTNAIKKLIPRTDVAIESMNFNVTPAPRAPTDTDTADKFAVEGTMVITIPHDFAWGSTAPMRFTLHVKSKWVAKF